MPNPFTDATSPRDWQEAVGAVQNPFVKGKGIPAIMSNPSKMPCKSWGLPSRDSCPGYHYSLQLDKNGFFEYPKAVCLMCYATKAEKFYTPGEEGVEDKEAKLQKAFKEGLAFVHQYHMALTMSPSFVDDMVLELKRQARSRAKGVDPTVFRLHWCGDMYSAEYCMKWKAIMRHMPEMHFWVPTRAWVDRRVLAALRKLAQEPNVTVRPSSIQFDDPPPEIEGLHAGSTAHLHDYQPTVWLNDKQYRMAAGPGEKAMKKHAFLCPATTGEGEKCNEVRGEDGRKPCRACWHRDTPVSYRQH